MQKKVEQFNEQVKQFHTKQMSVQARVLDIQSEVGELAKEVLKSTGYGTKDFVVSQNYQMEFGDVLYALLSLALETGIDAEQCLQMALDKMQTRLQTNNNLGSGR
jgi:NTP pyrophosphatase (non-canonical NTP hydrolase)